MKRSLLLLSCVAILAATAGCRLGNPFNWRSGNDSCCGPVQTISPTVTNYPVYDSYEGDSSVIMSPPETILPAPAR